MKCKNSKKHYYRKPNLQVVRVVTSQTMNMEFVLTVKMKQEIQIQKMILEKKIKNFVMIWQEKLKPIEN
jgi:hypothetical protein